jgi:endonuclease/exonuclease/phosphatase family metal-dependent hydrolase
MAPLTVLTWNLFHGRDHPLEGSDEHASVNRPLRDEFAATLAREPWDVALLQEAPPHWLRGLAQAADASAASVLTSRNVGAFLRRRLAEWNPDLIKSGEGGSNQILVRSGWRIAETRRLTLTLLPERRRLIWARLAHPEHGALTVATLHATAHVPAAAARDVESAARAACAWSAELPLVFGGDLNLRMAEVPDAFHRLHAELDLQGARTGRAIDHLLARGLRPQTAPGPLPAERREVRDPDGLLVRLFDHAPVVATYDIGSAPKASRGE